MNPDISIVLAHRHNVYGSSSEDIAHVLDSESAT